MPSPDWKDIESLFEAALDHPEPERLNWLQETCPDPDLFREVAAMLRAADRAEDFLSQPASETASALIIDSHRSSSRGCERTNDDLPEGRIGRYRTIRRIGRGGAGAVFLGERADGEFRQRVAIKLLREDRMSRSQQRRFLAERQILATLNHPGIARLLDGGVTDEGIPFIVMDYIDGQPIDDYCDDRRLPLRARLELFRKVCVAVQHAHGQLVVHRDIKPSNVMVTETGDVKLVDFGIAKLLDPEHDLPGTGRPTLNLTPEYASPEQVRGEAITVVSDVYSLGVLLYQLLTGRRPYEMSGASAVHIVRTVCETEPSAPSDCVLLPASDSDDDEIESPEEIARRRGVSVDTLHRQLRGDIDTIVLKALRKEPARRYQSVESFADDINRFLTSRPVQARRDTWAYRVSKYVRRNRIVVAAVSVVAMTLVGGLAISLWQASERAEEAARAERTTRFMTEMLSGFDPNARPGELRHVEQILDMGVQRLHQDLAGEPELSAEIAVVLADLYQDYGLYEKARDLYELSIARQRARGRKDARMADVTAKLGWVANRMGDHRQARELMLSALEINEAVHGPNSIESAGILDGLAVVYINTGQLDRSRELLEQALAVYKSVDGDDHVRVARSHRHLAYVNYLQHRTQEADSLYRLALASMIQDLGTDHTDVAQTMHDHGSLLVRMGRLIEAEDYLRRALKIRRERLGDRHPQVAQSLSHIGLLMSDRGRFDDAETMLTEALEIRREAFGERHLTYAHSVNQLSQLYHARGDHAASEKLLLEAIDLYRDLLGPRHVQTAAAMQILGRRLAERADYAEAAKILRDVLDIRLELLGESTLPTTESMLKLGETLLALGKKTEALELLTRATELREELYGIDHVRTREVRLWQAIALSEVGRYVEAEKLLTEIVATMANELTVSEELRERARQALSHLYERWRERP